MMETVCSSVNVSKHFLDHTELHPRRLLSTSVCSQCCGNRKSHEIHSFIYLRSIDPYMAGRPVDIEIVSDKRTNLSTCIKTD
jgi:hypothetical protein